MKELLDSLFCKLIQVQSLRIIDVKNQSWSGVANVSAITKSDTELVFEERGFWVHSGCTFSSVVIWKRNEGSISLSKYNPQSLSAVHLVDFCVFSDSVLLAKSPHMCNLDCYSASLTLVEHKIVVCWNVFGPKKDQELLFTYE